MSARVYVGNLPGDVREGELEDMFYRYRPGRIDIKRPPRGPAFAFVEFRDIRDAEDAAYDRDGINFDGGRIRVEISRGRDRGFEERPRGGGRPPSEFTLRVSGLPDRTSWQDLKDFARSAGDVNFAKMVGPDVGLVDFYKKEDFEAALVKLDGAPFKNRFGDETKIRVEHEAPPGPPKHRSRSPPRGDDRGGPTPGRYDAPPAGAAAGAEGASAIPDTETGGAVAAPESAVQDGAPVVEEGAAPVDAPAPAAAVEDAVDQSTQPEE